MCIPGAHRPRYRLGRRRGGPGFRLHNQPSRWCTGQTVGNAAVEKGTTEGEGRRRAVLFPLTLFDLVQHTPPPAFDRPDPEGRCPLLASVTDGVGSVTRVVTWTHKAKANLCKAREDRFPFLAAKSMPGALRQRSSFLFKALLCQTYRKSTIT